MGRYSNLILLDGEDRIIDCLRRVDMEMSERRQVRGRGRVLPDGGGEVDPGLAGPGAEEQFFVPPQGKDHLVPGGLLDLLHPPAPGEPK